MQQKKKVDETQVNYTLAGAMNQQMKQNTFRQEIAKQKLEDAESSEERKGQKNSVNKNSADDQESDSSLNSEVNELDLEAEAEYDIKQP